MKNDQTYNGWTNYQHTNNMKNKYLIALPCFSCKKNFNHQTILVSAKDEADAINLVFHLRPQTRYIGKIKQVNY